eukprot:tig00000227_g19845.t1
MYIRGAADLTYQAGVEGSLPALFRSLHPSYGTPEKAIYLCTAVSAALALLGLAYVRPRRREGAGVAGG